MDYSLLTAAHLRRGTSAKMDARREQAYYDSAEDSSRKLESLMETAVFPFTLARQALALARQLPTHFGAAAPSFSFVAKARKSLT